MNRPSTQTMVLGHPLVSIPVMLAGAGMLYVCWQGGVEGIPVAIIPAATMLAAARAGEQASAYKRWKREWDAMAPPDQRQPSKLPGIIGVILGFMLVLAGIAAANADARTNAAALGWLILIALPVLAFFGVRASWRRARRRPSRTVPAKPVAVIARTILPVPTLGTAYATLPEHCQRLLARSRS